MTVVGSLCAVLLAAGAQDGIRTEAHGGWKEAVVLESKAARVELKAVPAVAGRVVHYSLDGENIIFVHPNALGRTLESTGGRLRGAGMIGYQIDIGPELRGIPRHLPVWMGPHAWTRRPDRKVRFASPHDPAVGLTLEKEMKLDPKTGSLAVWQKMKNTSKTAQSYCLWDRTLCRNGGFVVVPLTQGSRYPEGWGLRHGKGYDGGQKHPKVRVIDGALVVHAEGERAKLGSDSQAGWIAYVRDRLLFVKYFPVYPGAAYTDGGNTVEVYWDSNVAELEPLSPEVRLEPGQEYVFPEKWILLRLTEEVKTAEQARAAVRKLPHSPFK